MRACPQSGATRAYVTRDFLSRLVVKKRESAKEGKRIILAPSVIIHEKLGVTYGNRKRISSGTYGVVYAYTRVDSRRDSGVPSGVAVKVFFKPDDVEEELNVIAHLKKYGFRCEAAFMMATAINDNDKDKDSYVDPFEYKEIVMEQMSGDLGFFQDKSTVDEAANFCLAIARACRCLASQGLYYCDLKPANTLFACNLDGSYDVRLGDLGSAQRKFDRRRPQEAVMTYSDPLADLENSDGRLVAPVSEELVARGIATVFACLLKKTEKDDSAPTRYLFWANLDRKMTSSSGAVPSLREREEYMIRYMKTLRGQIAPALSSQNRTVEGVMKIIRDLYSCTSTSQTVNVLKKV